MRIKHKIHLLFAGAILLLAASCSDDDSEIKDMNSQLSLNEEKVEISYEGRYYSVTAKLSNKQGTASLKDVRATVDADWIQLDADTVTANGTLLFYVTPNEGDRSRDGKISFRVGDQVQAVTFSVHQTSEAEEGTNALNGGELTRMSRVGYGYNMLLDYMDPQSVTAPILSYEKIIQAEAKWGTIIAESNRSVQDLVYHSSYSVEEMASWMTKQSSTETDILGFNKTVEKYKKISTLELDQQTYGYSSIRKIISARYVDEGMIEGIIRAGDDIFTDEFRSMYNAVNSSPSSNNVETLVRTFGTHLVTYADLGGRMDYMVNFRSEETSKESVEKYMKYKNGQLAESSESNEASHAICTSGTDLTFDIYGGSANAIEDLKSSSDTKSRNGQVSPTLLGNWLNSIKASDPSSVSMVGCQMIPIWQLFSNESARKAIISYILELAYNTDTNVGQRLQDKGLDNYYKLDISSDMFSFGNSPTSTLAKIVYYAGVPKVEICNEYVPEIRSDRRVTIFYPIYKQQTNIRRGLFLGDGENVPAEVTFDNVGGCYVRPLAKKYKPGDRLTTIYYIDGAFYDNNLGIKIPAFNYTVKDEWLNLFNHKGVDNNGNYPVVKIGPGFWTRCYITDELGFEDEWEDSAEDIYTIAGHQVLFADVFYDVNPSATNIKNFTLRDNGYWYLPTSTEMTALLTYVGNNPKALFQNQMTGFEAEFYGYLRSWDILTNQKMQFINPAYQGELCVLAFHDSDEYGQALVIKPDYTWQLTGISKSYRNEYPIRPLRNKKYKHENL